MLYPDVENFTLSLLIDLEFLQAGKRQRPVHAPLGSAPINFIIDRKKALSLQVDEDGT